MNMAFMDRSDVSPAESVEDYLDTCVAAGLRGATVSVKRCTLGQFLRWAEAQDITTMSQVTTRVSTKFLKFLIETPSVKTGATRSLVTVKCAARIIKTWLGWAYRNHQFDSERLRDYVIPKCDDSAVYMATIEDVQTILQINDDFWDIAKHPEIKFWPERSHRFFRLRLRAMIAIEVSVGLRGGELLAAQTEDYTRGVEPQIKVRKTKGRKERSVPVSRYLTPLIEEWLRVRPKRSVANNIIVTETGTEMSRAGATRQFKRLLDWGREHGYPTLPHITMHSLRHQALNAMLQVSPEHARKLGGHAKLASLGRYEHTVDKSVRSTHAAVDPLMMVLGKAAACKPRVKKVFV